MGIIVRVHPALGRLGAAEAEGDHPENGEHNVECQAQSEQHRRQSNKEWYKENLNIKTDNQESDKDEERVGRTQKIQAVARPHRPHLAFTPQRPTVHPGTLACHRRPGMKKLKNGP